jgi:hypothetical protein
MECGACARNCPAEALYVRAGVGCAVAVVNSMLGRKKSSCCCTIDSEEMPKKFEKGFENTDQKQCC